MTPSAEWTAHLQGCIRAACVLEVTARKPGNVHPRASFVDVRFEDFLRSADVAAPVLAQSAELGVGRAIREAVSVTHRVVGRNTNLGIVLLLAPLAAVPEDTPLEAGIERVLQHLTTEDARECYAAIREAAPGGLGRADDQDVAGQPSRTLREVMALAGERDTIAAQYANGFADVFALGLPILVAEMSHHDWETAVIRLHLQFMARRPDTLIARKCGPECAAMSATRAQQVLDLGWPEERAALTALQRLDTWLRADGHRRNPGTTADLTAAVLFAALRDRLMSSNRFS